MEVKQHLERAIRIISAMRVDGDNQDLSVAAKNELRAALDKLQKSELPHEFDATKTEGSE